MLATAEFMSFCSMSIMAPFYPKEAANKGMTESMAGFVFGYYALVAFISSPIFGKVVSFKQYCNIFCFNSYVVVCFSCLGQELSFYLYAVCCCQASATYFLGKFHNIVQFYCICCKKKVTNNINFKNSQRLNCQRDPTCNVNYMYIICYRWHYLKNNTGTQKQSLEREGRPIYFHVF